MSKRNFTLFIIVLIIAVAIIFGFLYFNQGEVGQDGTSEGTNFLSRFNPFGRSKPATPPETTEPVDLTEPVVTPGEETPTEKLQKISSMPVAGFEILIKERLKEIPTTPLPLENPASLATPVVNKNTKPTPPPTELVPATRYVTRATGNIYQTFLDKIEERKFSTTIIPKIYEAYFGNKDSSVIMRYLKPDNRTIQTFLGNIPKEVLGADTEENEIQGTFLPDGITDMSLLADGSKAFYLLNVGDVAVGTILNFADGKKTQVFDSPFTEWLSLWPSTNMITLTTKPSGSVPGHMYALNPTTKSLNRVLGDVYGLTTLASPDGKSVLYGDSSLSLNIYNISKNTSQPLGVRTLPEKCAWGVGSAVLYCAVPELVGVGQYPDSWYQGEVSFSDQIWKIDATTGYTEMIADPMTLTEKESIDGIKLALDKDGKYLLLVNKKDSFLWKLDLE